MKIPIFLSYPKPYLQRQQDFLDKITKYLEEYNIQPITLGVMEYDINAPLIAIRRLLTVSFGMLVVAFRRGQITEGATNPNSDIGRPSRNLANAWMTSPYCHIEPAMAFQIGLPILVIRENGVITEGMLSEGAMGLYTPKFDLDNEDNYLDTQEWKQLIDQWRHSVMTVYNARGNPPKLY
jgi:hypothetical protein